MQVILTKEEYDELEAKANQTGFEEAKRVIIEYFEKIRSKEFNLHKLHWDYINKSKGVRYFITVERVEEDE